MLVKPIVQMWCLSTWLWVNYELHNWYNILKINKFKFIGVLENQLTSNQQVGGSSPPGIAMLSCGIMLVFPQKPPVSCVVDGLILLAWSVACHSKSGVLSDRRVTSEWPTSCLDWVPLTTNTTPGGFDEQRFQKRGLKGALVVVWSCHTVSSGIIVHLTAMRRYGNSFEQVAIFLGKLRTTLLPNLIASLIGFHVAIF